MIHGTNEVTSLREHVEYGYPGHGEASIGNMKHDRATFSFVWHLRTFCPSRASTVRVERRRGDQSHAETQGGHEQNQGRTERGIDRSIQDERRKKKKKKKRGRRRRSSSSSSSRLTRFGDDGIVRRTSPSDISYSTILYSVQYCTPSMPHQRTFDFAWGRFP